MRQATIIGVTFGIAGLGLICQTTARAQENLGSAGAASGIGSGMNAQGAGASGQALRRARQRQAQNANPEGAPPDFPAGAGEGGAPGEGGAAAPAPTIRRPDAVLYGNETGDTLLGELLRGGGSRPATSRSNRTSRSTRSSRNRRSRGPSDVGSSRLAQSRSTGRVARSGAKPTRAELRRSRSIASKYQIPARGYLSYYLPQDRYKIASSDWRFVSIEDDQRAYPVRYYYRANAPTMLRLLTQPVRGLKRPNRVIGFHTWQEAMIAGYRPDPVTRPEPGAQIADLARLTRGPELTRYVEFVYSGQISPEDFAQTYSYSRRVERVVNQRPDTRPLLGQTIGQVLAAAIGEGTVPTTVGGTPPPAPKSADEVVTGEGAQ